MIIYIFIKASKKGQLETIKYLIEKGAHVNKENNNGNTPLFWGNLDKKVKSILSFIL